MDLNKTVNIKNRSGATVCYKIPDTGVTRTWSPNEVKKGITIGELEQVTYVPGGTIVIQDYLLINDAEVCEYLGIETEPEYFYSEAEIRTLLSTGTIEQFLDCLDFAPDGVLDLIKKISVETKLNDVAKRNAIKEKLGLDVTAAIANNTFANEEGASTTPTTGKKRRQAPITGVAPSVGETSTGRRTSSVPTYNRVK